MIRHTRSRSRGLLLALSITALLAPATVDAGGVDAPDTCAAAAPIAVGTSWTLESLSTAGDRDWFAFTIAAHGYRN